MFCKKIIQASIRAVVEGIKIFNNKTANMLPECHYLANLLKKLSFNFHPGIKSNMEIDNYEWYDVHEKLLQLLTKKLDRIKADVQQNHWPNINQ